MALYSTATMYRGKAREARCLAIPEGVSVGAVIGKGGSHFNRIRAETGATLFVRKGSEVVEIRGGDAATAEALLREHLQYLAQAGAETERLMAGGNAAKLTTTSVTCALCTSLVHMCELNF